MGKQSIAEHGRKLRAHRKLAHLCERCGKPLSEFCQFVQCELCRAKRREYGLMTRDSQRAVRKAKRLSLKTEVLQAYGGKCVCCGETEPVFLEIDHIGGKGTEHRKSIGSTDLYYWYKANGFPDGFQVLCANCHRAKTAGVVCPHKRKDGVS